MGDDSFTSFLCDDDNYWDYYCETGDDPFNKYDLWWESESYKRSLALEKETEILLDQLRKKYPSKHN